MNSHLSRNAHIYMVCAVASQALALLIYVLLTV